MSTKGGIHPIFVYSQLDDYGLDPYEFRLYGHIARRGYCYARLDTIAKICKMSVRKAQYALATLEEVGLISKKVREKKKTSIYELTPTTKWKDPDILEMVRLKGKQPKGKRSASRKKGALVKSGEDAEPTLPPLDKQLAGGQLISPFEDSDFSRLVPATTPNFDPDFDDILF